MKKESSISQNVHFVASVIM